MFAGRYSSMTMGWVRERSSRWRRASSGGHGAAGRAYRWPRVVPASMLRGAELVHLGGGELLPCPDAESLPLGTDAIRAGLGTSRLALPPARLHVLRDALIHPGSGVVTTLDGRIVAESVTVSMVGRVALDHAEMRAKPVEMDGTVAVFRSPLRSQFHTLVDDMPRAGLLIHPAVGRLGNMQLVHDGPLTDAESTLLAHLGGRRVRLSEVVAGRPIRAQSVVVPNYVTRTGAGAVPSWYRRWADGVALPVPEHAPRRVFLDAGVGAKFANRLSLLDTLERHDVQAITPSSMSAEELFSTLRDAELVVGSADGGLAGCLFSTRAHVVETLDDVALDPEIYYLAASRGLPYDFVPAMSPPTRRSGSASVLDIGWLDRLLDRLTT